LRSRRRSFSSGARISLVFLWRAPGRASANWRCERRSCDARPAYPVVVGGKLHLALIGGSLGLFLEVWGQGALLRLVPADLPRIENFSIDWQVFAFAASSL